MVLRNRAPRRAPVSEEVLLRDGEPVPSGSRSTAAGPAVLRKADGKAPFKSWRAGGVGRHRGSWTTRRCVRRCDDAPGDFFVRTCSLGFALAGVRALALCRARYSAADP